MSEVLSKVSHFFYTDLGAVIVDSEEVEGYDVEDVVSDKVYSQAEIAKLENIASNINVNALKLPRQIKSDYYL